jgi:hypothetical protein
MLSELLKERLAQASCFDKKASLPDCRGIIDKHRNVDDVLVDEDACAPSGGMEGKPASADSLGLLAN